MNEKMTETIVYGRSRTYTPHFYGIAKNHSAEFARFTEALAEAEQAGEVPPDLRTAQCTTGHIVIVFSWMTLESLVYDYAAVQFSDTYVKKYLETMSTLSKLIVIPQLASGNKFPTDGQAYQYLDELQKVRNDLVHYKSSPVIRSDDDKARSERKVKEAVAAFPDQVQHAFAAIEMYVDAVIGMHADGNHRLEIIKEFITSG